MYECVAEAIRDVGERRLFVALDSSEPSITPHMCDIGDLSPEISDAYTGS